MRANTLYKMVFTLAFVTPSLVSPVEGGMIGVEVWGNLGGSASVADGTSGGFFTSPTSIVGPGLEFVASLSHDQIRVDFNAATNVFRIDFQHNGTAGHSYLGFGSNYFVNWGAAGGAISSFTLLPGNTLPISSFGFTSNSLDVDFTSVSFSGPQTRFAEFQLEATQAPEPSSVLLLCLGGAALTRFGRRRQPADAATLLS